MAQCAAAPVCRHFNTEFDSRLAGAEQKTADDPAFEFARKLAADNPDPNQAFHGYKFRIGSELSVVVVLVAYPAEYGISGVMTLLVLPGGAVYEKDLGPETGDPRAADQWQARWGLDARAVRLDHKR